MLKTPKILILLTLLLGISQAVLARSIIYPIVFVHGFGESAERWNDIKDFFDRLELKFGGVLTTSNYGNVISSSSSNYNKEADYFFVEFSENQLGIDKQVQELRKFIEKLHEETHAARFVLVGFSMGGLTARAYLTEYLRNHRIAKLVTITAPHQGSNWAEFYKLAVKCRDIAPIQPGWWKNLTTKRQKLLCNGMNKLGTIIDLRFMGEAMRDMMPDSIILTKLANAEHPLDVQYANVVAKTPSLEQPFVMLEKYFKEEQNGFAGKILNTLTSPVVDFGREHFPKLVNFLLYFNRSQTKKLHANKGCGDGAVSIMSQDMSQLPWFKQHIVAGTEIDTCEIGDLQKTVLLEQGRQKTSLEIFKIDEHHLAAPRNYKLLQEILSGTAKTDIKIKASTTFWDNNGSISGRVNNYLSNVKHLKLEQRYNNEWRTVDREVRIDDSGFIWDDIPLGKKQNEFRVSYTEMSMTGEGKLETSEIFINNVEITPNLLPKSVLVILIFFAIVGLCVFVYITKPDKIVDDDDDYMFESDYGKL